MVDDTLFRRIVIPVASKPDAEATARAAIPYLQETNGHATVVHVIEKAGGAPDKASVEQRELNAEEIFETIGEAFDEAAVDYETRIVYGTDIAEAVFEAAADVGASAVVFTPREASRWIRLLTGDVSLSLVTKTDRPVVVLPDVESSEVDADG